MNKTFLVEMNISGPKFRVSIYLQKSIKFMKYNLAFIVLAPFLNEYMSEWINFIHLSNCNFIWHCKSRLFQSFVSAVSRGVSAGKNG